MKTLTLLISITSLILAGYSTYETHILEKETQLLEREYLKNQAIELYSIRTNRSVSGASEFIDEHIEYFIENIERPDIDDLVFQMYFAQVEDPLWDEVRQLLTPAGDLYLNFGKEHSKPIIKRAAKKIVELCLRWKSSKQSMTKENINTLKKEIRLIVIGARREANEQFLSWLDIKINEKD